ncbi:DUF7948 domain-containing protein [Cohnella cholangitidis]|uniref:DUF7948 domain-containing protein n=1 Tax=Cohnella cholangitidis TaxID=2598458 RepID=A0A7G5BZV3_9BACL|nr:hypothetical protein [Cohnella cholangitidis]QMV42487.1 hypothetical protein FPL14_15750 [Cohnella cholangitidis]
MPADNELLPAFPELYRHQPLLFIPNQGQADANVSFIAEKLGYYVGISSQEVSMTICQPNEIRNVLHLAWRFVGAAEDTIVEGIDQETGSFHYFTGPRSAFRYMNLPSYRKVICREIWQGIDVLIHEQQQSLKYDWIIRSNGRPDDIRLACKGCNDISLNRDGSLVVDTDLGKLIEPKPTAYQIRKSESVPVSCRYALRSCPRERTTIGFELPEGYDRRLELIIK